MADRNDKPPCDPANAAETSAQGAVEKIEHGTPAFLRTNLALFAAGFATFALLYCVQPLMPLFSADFGVSAAGASLALSASTGVLAVFMLITGPLSDIWGRKPIMVAALLLSSALTILCATLQHWPALLLARALMGITLSGLPAVAMAYVGEEMHPRSLGLAMGLYIGGSAIGGMSGRLLTGVITDIAGWRIAMTVIGVLGALCGAILWRSLPRSRHFTPREPRVAQLIQSFSANLRDPVLSILFAEGFLLMGSFVTIYNYVGYRLMAPPFSLSQTAIGLIFSVYLSGIVSSACMGALSGRLGRLPVIVAALVLMLAGLATTLLSQLWLIIFGIVVLTFGFFGAHTVVSAWIGARARHGKGQASSLYLFAYYMGSSAVGSLGGLFWGAAGWGGVIAMTGALVLAALAMTLRLKSRSA